MYFPRAVPQSPGFGLLSPFHDEGEQSCGKKEEEESAENPVDLCIGQSKVQSYRNGDEDVGCGHKDKKRDDHPSSRPALLVEKRPRQTSHVIQRPHAETSIPPYQHISSAHEEGDNSRAECGNYDSQQGAFGAPNPVGNKARKLDTADTNRVDPGRAARSKRVLPLRPRGP